MFTLYFPDTREETGSIEKACLLMPIRAGANSFSQWMM